MSPTPSQSNPAVPGNEACPAELPNFCARRHWSIFWILILCSVGSVCGRIVTLNHHTGRYDTPFYSANDRSRWATVRSLGDSGTYEIDEVIFADEPIGWDSIDKVQHLGEDGRYHFYSSKPPLLPTILAGGYKVIKSLTGWTLKDNTHEVVRVLLLLLNGGGWFLFVYFLARQINEVPVRDWARYYVLACGGFATFLSTYAISLNNHLPAAIAVMISLYQLSVIWRKDSTSWWWHFGCGLCAGLAVANELPALAFAALAGLLCLIKSPFKAVTGFAVGGLLVAAAFLFTNYQAHQTWQLAYGHRGDGPVLAEVEGDFEDTLDQGSLPSELKSALPDELTMSAPDVEIGAWPSTPEEVQRWVIRDAIGTSQVAITRDKSSDEYQIRAWNNWYDYPGSYWLSYNDDRKSKVDRGEASLPTYAFHTLFGHHGIFSLTPIWLFAFAGMIALAAGAKMAGRFQMRWLGWMTLLLSIVVLAFYLRRPEMDRNYGGVTSGLRWVFWLSPLWLVSMLPVIDWLGSSRWGRAICLVLLLASILSVSYSADNPWVHPWLYEFWES